MSKQTRRPGPVPAADDGSGVFPRAATPQLIGPDWAGRTDRTGRTGGGPGGSNLERTATDLGSESGPEGETRRAEGVYPRGRAARLLSSRGDASASPLPASPTDSPCRSEPFRQRLPSSATRPERESQGADAPVTRSPLSGQTPGAWKAPHGMIDIHSRASMPGNLDRWRTLLDATITSSPGRPTVAAHPARIASASSAASEPVGSPSAARGPRTRPRGTRPLPKWPGLRSAGACPPVS